MWHFTSFFPISDILICPTLISACEAAHSRGQSEQPVNLMVNKGLHVSKRSSPAKGHHTAPCSHSYDNAQVDWVSWWDWEKQKTEDSKKRSKTDP